MKHARLFGLPLTLATEADQITACMREAWHRKRPLLATFVNPYAWTLARRTDGYAALLARMDLVLPDGIGVVAVARRLVGQPLGRFSFDASSLYVPVMRTLAADGRGLFVVGARPGVAATAVRRMRERFADVAIVGVLDGFTPRDEAVERILAAAPDMVLCGMGAPHQEELLAALRDAGFNGVAFTCGGFLDQLAEAEAYYPVWIDRLELRWLWRIVKEPRRLWRRYAVDYQPFIRLSLGALLWPDPQRRKTT